MFRYNMKYSSIVVGTLPFQPDRMVGGFSFYFMLRLKKIAFQWTFFLSVCSLQLDMGLTFFFFFFCRPDFNINRFHRPSHVNDIPKQIKPLNKLISDEFCISYTSIVFLFAIINRTIKQKLTEFGFSEQYFFFIFFIIILIIMWREKNGVKDWGLPPPT